MNSIKIIRSNRKTLAIQVNENCEVIVRAPFKYPIEQIRKFVIENSDWIEKAIRRQTANKARFPELTDAEIDILKERAKDDLHKLVEYYSEIMGVKPTGFKITSAKKRFGSCSGKNSLCFSYRLMLYPQSAIEYVVVHELAHIRFHNHSKDFYRFIESVLPDYKDREKILKN